MTPTEAALALSKLVSSDESYFMEAVDQQHEEITWLVSRRVQAHTFVDRLFDTLEGAAKTKLENLLTHTVDNGLVPAEQPKTAIETIAKLEQETTS
jgi:hypothetical protein